MSEGKPKLADLRIGLEEKARELGFCAVGFARADAAPQERRAAAPMARRRRAWRHDLDGGDGGAPRFAGRALARGTLDHLARHELCAGGATRWRSPTGPEVGRISVYAQGADYHDLVKKALKALARWLVEDGGLRAQGVRRHRAGDGEAARRSGGLGWQGKHTNLVSRTDGSWLFLGAIYTTLELDEAPAPHAVRCGSCTRLPRRLPDRTPFRRPSSSMRGAASPISRSSIRGRSRRNSGRRSATASTAATIASPSARGTASPMRPGPTRPSCRAPSWPRRALADLLALDDAGFRKVFAGSPIKRIGRNRMVRNAAIAAGNSGRAELAPALERLVADEDPVVAEAAEWGLSKLQTRSGSACRRPYLAVRDEGEALDKLRPNGVVTVSLPPTAWLKPRRSSPGPCPVRREAGRRYG